MPDLLVSNPDGDLLLSQSLQSRTLLTLGRSDRSTIVIPDDRTSRHHAVLFDHLGVWHLADLGSKAGLEDEAGKTTFHRFDSDEAWVRMGPVILWLSNSGPSEPEPAPSPMKLPSEPPFRIAAEFLRENTPPASPTEPLPLLLAGRSDRTKSVRILDFSHASRALIGSSGHADICIDDPAVSPLHAVIYREEDRWAIADAGSEQGLRANGKRWLRKLLEPGTLLEFGDTTLVPVLPEALFPEETEDSAGTEDIFDQLDLGSAFTDSETESRPNDDGSRPSRPRKP
jgi:pSer/pThr/pTyr-binding forkhead associated (FHA) protein